MTFNVDNVYVCRCALCESSYRHDVLACDGEAHYYVQVHMVDYCHLFKNGSSEALICLECFDSYSAGARKVIKEVMDGKRAAVCKGTDCDRYLTRMHSFFDRIEHAESFIADMLGEP